LNLRRRFAPTAFRICYYFFLKNVLVMYGFLSVLSESKLVLRIDEDDFRKDL
jgi:hypothetical protein